jgi:DNA modification methylase
MGGKVRCAGETFEEGFLPCVDLAELDPIDAMEIELEENIRRRDISWQEKAKATSQLFELRKLQADKAGTPEPTISDLTRELQGNLSNRDTIRTEILVSKHLSDPEVAKAKSSQEAFKVLKRREELKRSAELGVSVGRNFSSASHTLIQGNCQEILRTLPDSTFDCLLTDPPYGMNAQDFGNADGKAHGAHFYDDSYDNWLDLMVPLANQSFRVCKPQAHAYVFCDIDNFPVLLELFAEAGWRCFRTPLIWINPNSQRAPWPHNGPQRKYQVALYAIKGDRPTLRMSPDVVTFASDDNLNHPAQKPVALYSDFLQRSCRPGDSVLDPFCGSGTIFPSAHGLKIRATGIELDPSAYGIAVKRLSDLK